MPCTTPNGEDVPDEPNENDPVATGVFQVLLPRVAVKSLAAEPPLNEILKLELSSPVPFAVPLPSFVL